MQIQLILITTNISEFGPVITSLENSEIEHIISCFGVSFTERYKLLQNFDVRTQMIYLIKKKLPPGYNTIQTQLNSELCRTTFSDQCLKMPLNESKSWFLAKTTFLLKRIVNYRKDITCVNSFLAYYHPSLSLR